MGTCRTRVLPWDLGHQASSFILSPMAPDTRTSSCKVCSQEPCLYLPSSSGFYLLLFQYSCLENPMDVGAWKAAVHGVAEGRTRLSEFTFSFQFHVLEKEMATHTSVLAWRIPGTGKPGGLLSTGSHRVGHD